MLKEWLTHLRHLGHKALAVGLVVLLLLLAMGAGLWFLLRPQEGATVSSSPEVVYLSTTGGVVALRTSDGSLLWKLQTIVASPPVVMHGVVYVDGAASIYALDARDGHTLWQFQTVESLTAPQSWSMGWFTSTGPSVVPSVSPLPVSSMPSMRVMAASSGSSRHRSGSPNPQWSSMEWSI